MKQDARRLVAAPLTEETSTPDSSAAASTHSSDALLKRAVNQIERIADETGLASQVRNNPLLAVGVAVGVGFVLGGGVGGRSLGRLLTLASKAAQTPWLQNKLMDFAEQGIDSWLNSPPGPPTSKP
jgi:hypothetical protein